MSLPKMYPGKSELRHPVTHAPWISANPAPLQLGAYDLSLWRSHTFTPSPHKPLWAPVCARQTRAQRYHSGTGSHRITGVEPATTRGSQGKEVRWPLKVDERRRKSGAGGSRRPWGLQAKGVTCRGNSCYNQSCDRDISALHAHSPLG